MYTARHLIDDAFRNDLVNVSYFMELMRYPEKLPEVLRRMRYYGILSRYIPEFGPIMGLMQHDLFHITQSMRIRCTCSEHNTLYTGVVEEDYPLVSRPASACQKSSCCISPHFFMTSLKDAVEITQNWVPWMLTTSANITGCRNTIQGSSVGSSATTC